MTQTARSLLRPAQSSQLTPSSYLIAYCQKEWEPHRSVHFCEEVVWHFYDKKKRISRQKNYPFRLQGPDSFLTGGDAKRVSREVLVSSPCALLPYPACRAFTFEFSLRFFLTG